MKGVAIRLSIALLTFLVGIVTTMLLATPLSLLNKGIPFQLPSVAAPKSTSLPPEEWKKVYVDNKFSIYLPTPYKDKRGKLETGIVAGGSLFAKGMLFYYEYGRHVYRGWCEEQMPRQRSKVIVSGKKAWLDDRDAMQDFGGSSSMNDWPSVQVCFPDIGDGRTKLFVEIAAPFSRQLSVAKRIINSIEFK